MLERARTETPDVARMLHNKIAEVQKIEYGSLETYIREYLRTTGSKIEDLELCRAEDYEDGKLVIRHWLRHRNVEHGRSV